MVGQTRGPSRPNLAPPRSFHPTSPPSSDQNRGPAGVSSDPETPDPNFPIKSETATVDEDTKTTAASESPGQKSQVNSNSNQKAESLQTHVKVLNSEVPQYVKKAPQITNNQILSIYPSGKSVETLKQIEKSEGHAWTGGSAKNEGQPNFVTMQQKINDKLLSNQIPVQRLPEQQQFILKQMGSSDNIVTMATAKITEPNQNYFAMLTNKPQTNYLNYLSLPVNQQNFIAVEQQQKNNFVVMEAQPKTNFVTVPSQKTNVQSSGQAYLVHGNGADLKQFNSYLAVTTKPGDTNGTTFFTMTPTKHTSGAQTAYLMTPKQSESSRTFVAVAQKPTDATYLALPANKNNENNKTTTYIAMEPNKADTNIIVTQVLPQSQQSPQLFQLEYAENDSGKAPGKYYNSRDNAVVQSVVPKLSCNANSTSSVMSTKTAITTVPPLTSVGSATSSAKRSTSSSKALTPSVASPGKSNVPPLATSGNISFVSSSGNVTFLSSPNGQTTAGSNTVTSSTFSSSETRWTTESEGKNDGNLSSQGNNSSPSTNTSVPANTVLSSNVPHSHQYLIPNVDNLKLAAESISKMMPSQSNSSSQSKPPGILKVHQADQNFQMHNYSKNETSGHPNHMAKFGYQDNPRRKYGQVENNKMPVKNVIKYSHNMYSNHQRSDKNQNFGSYKSRVESRPTNHQRMTEVKNSEILKSGKGAALMDYVKKEIKEESGDIHGQQTRIKKEDEDEEEGVEVRPVFDMRIPLVFQVVLTDHCYGMPMLLLRDEKPLPLEDDKESIISSDGKGEDGEETETAAEGEDSITRCICDLEHDDGYMVCCDKCSVWQHVACVFPDVRVGTPLPEEYLCDACHPRKLDRNRARALQLQRRKQIFNNSDSSDSSSSSLEIVPRTKETGPKKPVARRRVDTIPRKPVKMGKGDSGNNDSVVKNSLLKQRRRDSNLKPSPQVGRRTKLKRKLESRLPRTAVRRKSKNKEVLKSDKDCSSSSGGNNNNNNNNYHQKERSDRNDGSEESTRKSPDIRTRLQMLKSTSLKELSLKASQRVRCRLSHLPQGDAILVTSCSLSRGQLIVEIRGKFLLSEEQPGKSDCLFFYRFPKDDSEIVVDGTGQENLTRYARRSCRPNAQMKHCIVKGSLRLYLVAGEDMGKNQEITIAHNSINDNSFTQKDGCLCKSKDCPFFLPKNSQNTSTERRKRGRRRTMSEESEGSPMKNKKEKPEPPRRNTVTQSSRSPSSPIQTEPRSDKEKDRKLTRDERKIEQAMKIFAQMERDTARKKDKDRPQMPVSNNRKDSHVSSKADSDKESPVESNKTRRRRRRRRRRSRKVRLSSTASSTTLTQFNSGDSDLSSGDELPSPGRKGSSKDSRDEDMQSPIDKLSSPRSLRRDSCSSREKEKRHDAAGLLLALGGRYLPGQKTPTREKESENEGSPPTPLSSACLLVAAAVGPLAPGFRFPKTKKGLMNEWLSKSPEHSTQDFSPTPEATTLNAQSESSLPPGAPKLSNLSNRLFNFPIDSKSIDAGKDSRIILDGRGTGSGTPAGFGKKRWLRQAISEESDAPQGQSSPPCPPDNVTPLKKRRLARESLSSDPPTTPPMPPITTQAKEDRLYVRDSNSPESPTIIDTESEISLAERVDALRREYLEAQERNLLKTYGRYENECTTRSEKDSEEYERFNNFQTSPQRVPENLSYKYSEDKSEEVAPTVEKPLDLTGEKEKEESSDVDMDNEKVESSPKHLRKVRSRKGGTKKGCNEVRTSPRFRKGTKVRKSESEAKGRSKENEEKVSDGNCIQKSDNVDGVRSQGRVPPPTQCVEVPTRNLDPRLRNNSGYLKTESVENHEAEINVVDNPREIKPDVNYEVTEEADVSSRTCLKTDKLNRTSKRDVISNQMLADNFDRCKQEEEDVRDVKVDDPDEKIVQNGFEKVKVEESNRGLEARYAQGPRFFKCEVASENSLELHTDSKSNEDLEQFSTAPADKSAPTKRKLSITEYLKRKKGGATTGGKSSSVTPVLEEDSGATVSPHEGMSPLASSPSDEDRSRVSLPTPTLPPVFFEMDKVLEKPSSGVRFKSEPTELERQRENLTERLRREFGLLIADDEPKPIKMDAEDLMPPPPPPPNCPYPSYPAEPADYLDSLGKRSLYHPPTQTLPQSAIYPVGSSNPPNPCSFNSPYSSLPPLPTHSSHEDKRKDRKSKKFK
ncbi:hypothetical protein RUM43_008053 [Polyplax serrata]|uniref:SET domain-containing protein n=1 Tax=Polyplax serrata TaxID=468196 RepID=A0AAN8Q6R1_POLSC